MNRDMPSPEQLRRWLTKWVATNRDLDHHEIRPDRPLEEYGLSSRGAVALAADLGDELGVELRTTLLWEQPTINDLVRQLVGERSKPVPSPPPPSTDADPIAVIGVGCRFPGATGPEQFWHMLLAGQSAVNPAPAGRWECDEDVRVWGGYLDDVAGFDAAFFGIAPREAQLMDPQQRLLLEVAHEALMHAGIAPRSLRGSDTGVFTGISTHDYAHLTLAEPGNVDMWAATGAAGSIAANRLSYVLDLRGPSVAVDTACSSSLVAVHQAVTALRTGETVLALACGVNVILALAPTLAFSRGDVLARDGRCKPFDATADGISRGEGCGVVVLKRLADAERDGDRVLAVIRATTVNSDGRSNGLTAPNPIAQEALLSRAYQLAGVDPSTVDYVEAHGTGTFLGDPIEAGALGAILGAGRQPHRPLLLGAVKANIAHTEAAAGIAGLIKVVLAMEHGQLPPTLHFTTPNPHIPFERARLRVVTDPTPWPRYGGTASAGVSAFGFGGTNAHVVLEEPPPAATPTPSPGPQIAILSSPSSERLTDTAARLADWLEAPENPDLDLADIAYTLARRDNGDRFRAAIVATDLPDLTSRLRSLTAGAGVSPSATTDEADEKRPVFVFSGYGSQWPGMGATLLATEPAFAEAVNELDAPFIRDAGFSLREVLGAGEETMALDHVQLVIFGIQLALVAQWRALGMHPAAVIGHSMGEVAAAVVAGGLSVDDGVRVMAVRSALLRSVHERGGGAMAAVELSETEFEQLRARFPSTAVAVYSSPEHLTIAGDADEIHQLAAHVEGMGRTARLLPVSGAGHTDAVLPITDQLHSQLGGVLGKPPTIPLYGTVLDDPRTTPTFDPTYWTEHARMPVRFAQAVTAAALDGHRCFLEVSPHPIASTSVASTVAAAGADRAVVAASLRRGRGETSTLLAGLAELYRAGTSVAWRDRYSTGRLIDLPDMPWRHQNYWIGDGEKLGRTQVVARSPRPVEPTEERAGALAPPPARERVAKLVATVMGFTPDELDPERPLVELGLDSLMATRIRNTLRREFGIIPEQSAVLRGASVTDLANLLVDQPGVDDTVGAVAQPRDAAERLVARLWTTEIGEAPRGIHAELSATHHAHRARALAARLQAELGVRFDADELLRRNSLSSIAELVRPVVDPPAADNPVQPLKYGTGQPPLLLFHPAGGSCGVYRPLVSQLPDTASCIGFNRVPGTSLEERVDRYVTLVHQVQPRGPYRLAGWSFGGALAYGVACRLAESNANVTLVALLDTMLPLPDAAAEPRQSWVERLLRFTSYLRRTYGTSVAVGRDELAALAEEKQIDLVMSRVELAGLMSQGVLRHQRESFLDVLAAERATPRPYRGQVVLYRATEPYAAGADLEPRYLRTDTAAGWDELCPVLEVLTVPANHLSIIDPPHVDVIARHLTAELARQEAA